MNEERNIFTGIGILEMFVQNGVYMAVYKDHIGVVKGFMTFFTNDYS